MIQERRETGRLRRCVNVQACVHGMHTWEWWLDYRRQALENPWFQGILNVLMLPLFESSHVSSNN